MNNRPICKVTPVLYMRVSTAPMKRSLDISSCQEGYISGIDAETKVVSVSWDNAHISDVILTLKGKNAPASSESLTPLRSSYAFDSSTSSR